MDYITKEDAILTMDSKKEALAKMYSLFPKAIYRLDMNSFNSRRLEDFRVYVSMESFAEIATDYYISHKLLFDFSHPILIEPSWNTYKSDFFNLSLKYSLQYRFYSTNYGVTKEDGTYIPPIQNNEICTIRLTPENGMRIGLKEFPLCYNELCCLFDKNKDFMWNDKYQKELINVLNKIKKWKEAVKNTAITMKEMIKIKGVLND